MTQLHELLPGVYALEVPMDAKEIVVEDNQLRYFFLTYEPVIDLPTGNWSIICCSASVTEEEAGKIVLWLEIANMPRGWRDYNNEHVSYRFAKATESLASLIRSRGLDNKLNYVILKLEI